ncbi:hypothetical protein [Streptomyces sp. NPDC006997]|uniref:hypothetical protein n=1 Tax=Streptomyces sp. NPDC006997 TaxID=3155356 RepID=UPI0033DDE41E
MPARTPRLRETLLLLLARMLFPARGSHRAVRQHPPSPHTPAPPPPTRHHPHHSDGAFWYDTPLVRPYLRGHDMEVSA